MGTVSLLILYVCKLGITLKIVIIKYRKSELVWPTSDDPTQIPPDYSTPSAPLPVDVITSPNRMEV